MERGKEGEGKVRKREHEEVGKEKVHSRHHEILDPPQRSIKLNWLPARAASK